LIINGLLLLLSGQLYLHIPQRSQNLPNRLDGIKKTIDFIVVDLLDFARK